MKAHVESDETGGERYCLRYCFRYCYIIPFPMGRGRDANGYLVLLVPASLVPVLLVSLLVRLGAAPGAIRPVLAPEKAPRTNSHRQIISTPS